jgi:hypothetical protein
MESALSGRKVCARVRTPSRLGDELISAREASIEDDGRDRA